MLDPAYRHARKPDARPRPRSFWSRLRPLRWAAAMAALLVVAIGAVPAQAATGGAASFEAPPPPPAEAAPEGEEIAFSSPMRYGGASWYGPGIYGNRTACGQTLRPATLGVAHKTLPCGTAVKFVFRGHVLVTRVIDRGPYIKGRAWDLTEAASEALDFEDVGVGRLRYAVEATYARR